MISGHQSAACDGDVEILSCRILLRPADLLRSQQFYRDVLGLAVYRECGPPTSPGIVFFLGPGLLEVSGHSNGTPEHSLMIWLQVQTFTPSTSAWRQPESRSCACR